MKGIFDELCTRTEERGGAIHPSRVEGMSTYSSYYIKSHCHVTPFSSEILEVVMEEMVREAGAEILYDVQVCDVLTDGGKITGVVAAMKEGMAVFCAKTYIDCTGDADVVYFAGGDFVKGDEKDGVMQPVTLFFEVGNIDREKFVGALEEKKAKGELGIPGENAGPGILKKHAPTATGISTATRWEIMRNPLKAAGKSILPVWLT